MLDYRSSWSWWPNWSMRERGAVVPALSETQAIQLMFVIPWLTTEAMTQFDKTWRDYHYWPIPGKRPSCWRPWGWPDHIKSGPPILKTSGKHFQSDFWWKPDECPLSEFVDFPVMTNNASILEQVDSESSCSQLDELGWPSAGGCSFPAYIWKICG